MLARTQQNTTKMRPERRTYKYTNDNDTQKELEQADHSFFAKII